MSQGENVPLDEVDADCPSKPQSYFDLLSFEVIWRIVSQVPLEEPETYAGGKVENSFKERRIQRELWRKAGLPDWGQVSGMLYVACSQNRSLSVEVMERFWPEDSDALKRRGCAEEVLLGISSEEPAASAFGNDTSGSQDDRAEKAFEHQRALTLGQDSCRGCGLWTNTRCVFQNVPICVGCQLSVCAEAVLLSDALSVYDRYTVGTFFNVAPIGGEWVCRIRNEVSRDELHSRALEFRSCEADFRELDSVSARSEGDNFVERKEALTKAQVVLVAVEKGDEEQCAKAVQEVYGRRRRKVGEVRDWPDHCQEVLRPKPSCCKPTQRRKEGGLLWRNSLMAAARSVCVRCRNKESVQCTWYYPLRLCYPCHEKVCGPTVWYVADMLREYGLSLEPPKRIRPRKGNVKDLWTLKMKTKEGLLRHHRMRVCERQVKDFISQSYGTPWSDVGTLLNKLRCPEGTNLLWEKKGRILAGRK